MKYVALDLTIVSATPLSVGAGGSTGTLADKTIIRDGWGRPLIPGSQVKGKARYTAEQIIRSLSTVPIPTPFEEAIEQDTLIRSIFGSPNYRSPLVFADLPGVVGNLTNNSANELRGRIEQHHSQIRPSVAINRRRGTAEDARLLFQETALEGTRFAAKEAITGYLDHLWQVALLWAALRLTTRWGGATSRGLGWTEVTVHAHFDGTAVETATLTQELRKMPLSGGVV